MSKSRQVFIVDGVRTPFGKYAGGLAGVRPDDLLADVIIRLIARNSLPGEAISEVVTGCVNQSGEDNRNVARMSSLLAGIPVTVPAITVNRLCASGLSAIVYGARSILAGDADIILASGVESMSRAPYILAKSTSAYQRPAPKIYDSTIGWRFTNPKFTDLYPPIEMGETAENVATRYKISREDQDQFAFQSHTKSNLAWENGIYADQVVSYHKSDNSISGLKIDLLRDEGPRLDISLEKLGLLKPVFVKDGTVTPGNSSSINDGAGALILASEKACNDFNLEPIARYVTSGHAGVDPQFMGIGPIPATQIALRKVGWKIEDLTTIELNEAFASQVLAVQRELGIPLELMNPDGGAISLGHPLGASGIRLAMTAIFRMKRDPNQTRALLSACIGVGQGESILLEKC